MKIAEIFRSRQGEGLLTGTPSVFVRTSGCNLRCWFCDTPYTSWSPEGVDLSVEEILARAGEHDTPHVVITGGEPMLYAELVPLADALSRQGRHITIETAGTLDLPVACDLMSISPKLANSTPSAALAPALAQAARAIAARAAGRPAAGARLHLSDQVRRPLARRLRRSRAVPGKLCRNRPPPRAAHAAGHRRRRTGGAGAWLEEYCRHSGLHFCPRMQIEWYGLARGT